MPALLFFFILTVIFLAVIINTDKRIEAMKTNDQSTQTDSRIPQILETTVVPIPTSSEKPKDPEVCTTPGCVRAATHFVSLPFSRVP